MTKFSTTVKRLTIAFIVLFTIISCRKQGGDPKLSNKDISKVLEQMTQFMIQDVSNPPLAARFYTYACVLSYTVVALNDLGIVPLKAFFNEFPEITKHLDS